MILVPFLCGKAFINMLCSAPEHHEYTNTDFFLTGVLICVGLSEAAHLFGVFGHGTVTNAGCVFAMLVTAAVLCSILFLFIKRHLSRSRKIAGNNQPLQASSAIYTALPVFIIFLIEFIIIQVNDNIYTDGDMTVETVRTFIKTDSFYTVNPLTGMAYTAGVPSRLKILCLPGLYSFLSGIFRISPETLVWRGIPAFVLICTVAAYSNLADTLFGTAGAYKYKNINRKNVFLFIVGLFLLLGDYMYGMDGFLLLESGYRGVALRALVLVPYAISLTLRKKWIPLIMCIVVEGCIVWTFYGAGECLLVAAGLLLTEYAYKKLSGRREAV
jgi:hypothetical protein